MRASSIHVKLRVCTCVSVSLSKSAHIDVQIHVFWHGRGWKNRASAFNINRFPVDKILICASHQYLHHDMLGWSVATILRPPARLDRRDAPRIKCVYARCTLQHWRLMRCRRLQRMSCELTICNMRAKSRANRTGIERTADWCQFMRLSRRLPTVLYGDAGMPLRTPTSFDPEPTDHPSKAFLISSAFELQAYAHLQCLVCNQCLNIDAIKYSALFCIFCTRIQ